MAVPKKNTPVKIDYFKRFETICLLVESGAALRNSCKGLMGHNKFYSLIDENLLLRERYARACEARAESIFEDIIKIADEADNDVIISEDGIERVNNEVVQRSRLRVDARKWVLSKMNPKKYGDKIDFTADVKITGSISPHKWLQDNSDGQTED